jgi:putative addiction module killer protein
MAIKIRHTAVYRIWYKNLPDIRARVRIDLRLNALQRGTFGDHRSVGDGVFELRIDYGPGYRIYYTMADREIVVLLCGGDKRTQDEDLAKARDILRELKHGTV